jgi:hypothetical protein
MDIDIIKLNDINIKNLTFSKSRAIYQNKKKISIGYNNFDNFHILSPILTNNNYVSNILKLKFEPLLGDILIFYNLITNIEQLINTYILKIYKDYTISSIIKTDITDLFDEALEDYTKYISIDLHKNSKYKIYNNNNNECKLNKLNIDSKFKTLLKIDSIWIDTLNNKFGLQIDILQLKIIQPIYTIKCLIDNDSDSLSDSPNDNIKQIEYKPIKKNIESIIQNTSNISVQQNAITVNKIIFSPPDASQLLKIKNSLKKVIE